MEKSYYHLDHLNSTKVVTDESGDVVVNYTYRAFGEQLKRLDRSDNPVEDLGKYSYSGKELDEDIGLYYFNARFYDATTGRFINVDPIQDGQNWYVYCNNNPLNRVDSTGLAPGDPFSNQNDAAKDWRDTYYDDTARLMKELASSIYKNKDGTYSYTAPNIGEYDNVDPPKVPEGSKKTGDIHSHVGGHGPSLPDRVKAFVNKIIGRDSYLVDKDGSLYNLSDSEVVDLIPEKTDFDTIGNGKEDVNENKEDSEASEDENHESEKEV